MAISVADFWKLAVRTRALSVEEAKSLYQRFMQLPGAASANTSTVVEWLIAQQAISRYQAQELSAGNAGLFLWGDFAIKDRVGEGVMAGLYRAMHHTTKQPALLYVVENAEITDWTTAQQLAQKALLRQYPQAGRVFGLAEANGKRFLVVEDNLDKIATQATSPPVATMHPPVLLGSIKDDFLTTALPIPKAAIPDDRFSIPDSPIVRARKNANSTTWIAFGSVGSAAVLGLVLLFLWGPKQDHLKTHAAKEQPSSEATLPNSETKEVSAETSPDVATNDDVASLVEERKIINKIPDDGQTFWESPTSGPPLDLNYLANGGQMFLSLRPSELLASDEGQRVWQVLGARGNHTQTFLQDALGIESLAEVERLLVGFYPNDDMPPQWMIVATMRQARSTQDWLAAWKNPAEIAGPKKYYQANSWTYYLPPAEKGRVVVVAKKDLMTEMLSLDAPPVLRREMEWVSKDTDDTRQFTLLLAPNFLFTDGKSLLEGDFAKLRQPLADYLGQNVLAASLSFHVAEENLFGELRIAGALDRNPYQIAEDFRVRLGNLPSSIEEYLATLNPHEYGRRVLARMPRMVSQLAAFTRTAAEHKQAVLRCFLPASAAHNLVLATELALSEQPGTAPQAVVSAGKPPATVEAALQQKISLSFPRNTLEKCMEMLGDEIGVPVHIEGRDLQLEGITKNQSFQLDERGKPADEILRKVMLLANPDGKLVYVIKPLEPGGKDVVFVTTRAAVARRGDKLPAELQ